MAQLKVENTNIPILFESRLKLSLTKDLTESQNSTFQTLTLKNSLKQKLVITFWRTHISYKFFQIISVYRFSTKPKLCVLE